MFVVHTPSFLPDISGQPPQPTALPDVLLGLPRALVRPDAQQPARCRTVTDSPRWPASVPKCCAKQRDVAHETQNIQRYSVRSSLLTNQYLYAFLGCLPCSMLDTSKDRQTPPSERPWYTCSYFVLTLFDSQLSGVDHPTLAPWLPTVSG